MADKGAGEGPRPLVSMPSPYGRGRGRGIHPPTITNPTSPGSACQASMPLPGSPGVAGGNGVQPAACGIENASSPGRRGELRRPKLETQERLLGSVPSVGPGGDAPQQPEVVKNILEDQKPTKPANAPVSKPLNVNAPVFISTLSATAQEFVPRSFKANQPPPQPASVKPIENAVTESGYERIISAMPTSLTTPTNNYAIDRVKQVVFKLTIAPGNMEDFMSSLIMDLNMTPVDLNTVIDIINVIFEQAVVEPNFTYSAARMCDWLHREYKPQTVEEPLKFLNLLLKRCQLEHSNAETLAVQNPQRLQGFTMFMAELFQNIKISHNGTEERIEKLGNKLKELVKVLLQFPSETNLKCVVRILKCTGAVLEDAEKTSPHLKPEMDNIFALITQHATCMSPNTSDTVRGMLIKLTEIRLTNWGRAESTQVVHAPVPVMRPPSPFTQTDPVFFNQYGQEITREEAGFAEPDESEYYNSGQGFSDSWSSQEALFDYENGIYPYIDDEIDDEIAEAFEQFLVETGQ